MKDKLTLRVVVLDDDLFMVKLLRHQLLALGFSQVTTCDSGHAALDLIGDPLAAVGLVLCDLNMPEMDGIEFIRHLVSKGYQGNLILVSGVDERILQAAERLVKEHGIALLGCLQKPIAREALDQLLRLWIPDAPRDARAAKRNYGVDEVRAALANNQLLNYYQPKIAINSGELVGVEALVRWNHPLHGLVYPDQFIAETESHGMIDDLTRVVLTAALNHAQAWHEAGLLLTVAVNVSMESLSALDFPNLVANLTARAGMASRHLVLEVTESRVMKDMRAVLEILTRLRLKGFGLSIDDFGTGHSSLSQLRDLPFNELKVDRGFVHGAWNNNTTRAIYHSSLAMGTQLQLAIVAEGAEDRDDWDFLQRTGCQLAQGYFIAKPMPADALLDWAARWRERVRDEHLCPGT